MARFVQATPPTFYLLPALVFLVVPAIVATNNDLSVFDISAWSWGMLTATSVTWFLILVALRFVARALHFENLLTLLVGFLAYFVLVAGLYFPVTETKGLVDPEEVGLVLLNFFLCLVIALGLVALSETDYRRLLHSGIGLLVTGNVLFVLAVGLARAENQSEYVFDLPQERNLIVISFDGLSGSAMNEALEDSELADALNGFTVFQNVASSSPASSMSIAAELAGNQNFKTAADTIDDVLESTRDRLIPNVLANAGYDVRTYGVYSSGVGDNVTRLPVTTLTQRSPVALLKLAMGRSLSRALVPTGSVDEFFSSLLLRRDGSKEQALADRVSRSHSPGWAKDLTMSIIDYQRILEGMRVTTSGTPVALFLHFTHTHFPVEFDGDCAFRGDSLEWFIDHQNYQGALEESLCALRQIRDFLNKLEGLGILKASMVVIKSDHGKPPVYGGPDDLEQVAIFGHPYYGLGRYSPFLAIKRFGEAPSSPVRFDQSPVLLDDLARTYCEESELDYDCNLYSGFNLTETPLDVPPDDLITMYVIKSRESTFRFETYDAVEVTRGANIVHSFFRRLQEMGVLIES